MSWLSPKRRRTTGNVKVLTNGNGQVSENGQATPKSSSPKIGSPQSEGPPSQLDSQSLLSSSSISADGNLFYAYARKADDVRSRHLLTFASATIANEWWELMQTHFPEASRPGPQLFSFKSDDLLSKAWRHKAFEPLKSKWMYIQFGDAGNVGGAAQGIIPVQDARGNMLGGSAPASPEIGKIKKEARAARNELNQLESHFEKMMAAMERNTAQIAALAEQRASQDRMVVGGPKEKQGSDGGYFDAAGLTGKLGEISNLLVKNSQHVENVSKMQVENEGKIQDVLQDSVSRPKAEPLDMSQLTSHLDRIQRLMEQSVQERKESEERQAQQAQRVQSFDFGPLAERLEKVQEAIEQNSALVRSVLEQGSSKASKRLSSAIDLSPLSGDLQRIHAAIEQQSAHMQALTGYVEEEGPEEGMDGSPAAGIPLLREHLDQIHNAIEEGNLHVRELVTETKASQTATFDTTSLEERLDALLEAQHTTAEREQVPIDFSPLTDQLDAIRVATEHNAEQLGSLIETHSNSLGAPSSSGVDFTPLTDRLNNIHASLEKQAQKRREGSPGTGDSKFLISALASHLSKIQAVTEANAQHVKALREKQSASQDKMHIAVAQTADLIRKQITSQDKMHLAVAQTADHIRKQSTSQDKMHIAVAQTADHIRTLSTRSTILEGKSDVRDSQIKELMTGQREMVDVMRELAAAITAQQKGQCDHVVIPPPRKVGRKIVGFVYDAKEGSI